MKRGGAIAKRGALTTQEMGRMGFITARGEAAGGMVSEGRLRIKEIP
jgi:hypothetical protein